MHFFSIFVFSVLVVFAFCYFIFALLLAPVAQLDRATDFESVGCPFDSGQARARFSHISDVAENLSTPSHNEGLV